MSRLFVGATGVLAIACQVAFGVSEERPAGLRLRAGACILLVDVADTPTRRETGLSHTAALPDASRPTAASSGDGIADAMASRSTEASVAGIRRRSSPRMRLWTAWRR